MPKKITLIIGDKNFSTWSMRPWLVLKAAGIPFTEKKILLDRPDTHRKIIKFSPSGKLPALIHGNLSVWDSLAICEYVNELAPKAGLWPESPTARARARAVTAEMHSGFS